MCYEVIDRTGRRFNASYFVDRFLLRRGCLAKPFDHNCIIFQLSFKLLFSFNMMDVICDTQKRHFYVVLQYSRAMTFFSNLKYSKKSFVALSS